MSLTTIWSPQQVLALAPDASSAKAGRELAASSKWIKPGHDARTIWGELQGSATTPYQTLVELTTPTFHCSCPSRKFPCKHALGLFLLFAQQPTILKRGEAPRWVQEWLAASAGREQARGATAEAPRDAAAGTVAQARRTARETNVASGLADLERWLHDLIRQGLAHAQTQPHHFWANQAARLVDAQAPGLANLLLGMAGIPTQGARWQTHLLERLALLHLLLAAYQRLADLPAAMQADVRGLVGWTLSQEEVLAQPGLRDDWLVLGQRVSTENNLHTQRTWLLGAQSGRSALLLHFAAPGQPLESNLVPGMGLDAEVVFYPSAWPLRALVKQRLATGPMTSFSGHGSLAGAIAAYSEALAHLPWLDRFPLALQAVTPIHEEGQWWVADTAGDVLPLAAHFAQGWTVLAETVATLRERPIPDLADINEAVRSVLCGGDDLPLRLIHRQLVVGEQMGAVPASASATPLQQDVQREQRRLRLAPAALERILALDLRKATDLERSHLLHRLTVLGVPWGSLQHGRGKGTFREVWRLAWQPEFTVRVVEAGLWGNTLAAAATAAVCGRALGQNNAGAATATPTLVELTHLLDVALLADLPAAVGPTLGVLQARAALAGDVTNLIDALPPLVTVARYGNVRQTDASAVLAIIGSFVARYRCGLTYSLHRPQ